MKSKLLIITDDVVNSLICGFYISPPLEKHKSIEDSAARKLANSSRVKIKLDGVHEISLTAINYLVERQDDICLGITEIDDEKAEAFGKFRKKLWLNNLSNISLSSLEILLSTPRELLSLDGLINLTPEQASIFSHFQGGLSLGGLTRINEEIAEHLSSHAGALYLENLKVLTTEETRHLVNHEGIITMNASLEVPREGAYLLRRHFDVNVNAYSHECYLEDCLADGADSAIVVVRKLIATHSETLILDSLHPLTFIEAKLLSQFTGDLQLPALENIDPKIACLLAQHNGPSLALDRLLSLTVPFAKALSKHCGALSLQGLVSFDEDSSRLLAMHDGPLILDGLKTLTASIAEGLGKHQGDLSLRGLVSFEEGSPELIALHDGPIALSLPDGGNDKFGWFKTEDRKVLWKPSGIDHHDLAVVENILKTHPEEIAIPEEVHFVSDTVFARLGYALRTLGVDVVIPGVSEINSQQCQLLTGNYLGRTKCSQTNTLTLSGLLCINDQVAEELGRSGLSLSLSGLSSASSEILRLLSQDIKDLALCGLTGVNEEDCKHLSNVKGHLRLDGINYLSTACAAAISVQIGKLTLNGILGISEEALTVFRHADPVELRGIQWMNMNSMLLEMHIKQVIILDDVEVFTLIREFSKFPRWKRNSNEYQFSLVSIADDSAMPGLIARILIKYLIRCYSIDDAKAFHYHLSFIPSNLHERSILKTLNTYKQSWPDMAIDQLIIYVSEKYINDAVSLGGEKPIVPVKDEERTFYSSKLGEVFHDKLYDIRNESHDVSSYDFYLTRINCPELNPMIAVCCHTAEIIMCSGLTGRSNISCETLVVLGLLFGRKLNFPAVDRLCLNGAMALSMLKAEIALNGIKELNAEVATLLSKNEGYYEHYEASEGEYRKIHSGALQLNGIQHLDVATAVALASHRGNILQLNGLTSVSNAVAEELGRWKECHKGYEYMDSRRIQLNGLRDLTPQSALSLAGCLGEDIWRLVDLFPVEKRFAEAMSVWRTGADDQAECVLDAFKDRSIFLSHKEKGSDLSVSYVALRNSLETKFGKASKPWVSCVVYAARALATDEMSPTEFILQETTPVVKALIVATAAMEEHELQFIGWVEEAGGSDAAHALLEKVPDWRGESQLLIDETSR